MTWGVSDSVTKSQSILGLSDWGGGGGGEVTETYDTCDDEGSPSADTCFDTERHACSQPIAFPIPFSQRTCKMPSTFNKPVLLRKFCELDGELS